MLFAIPKKPIRSLSEQSKSRFQSTQIITPFPALLGAIHGGICACHQRVGHHRLTRTPDGDADAGRQCNRHTGDFFDGCEGAYQPETDAADIIFAVAQVAE